MTAAHPPRTYFPVECSQCGRLGRVPVKLSASTPFAVSGQVTSPNCGGWADILSGVYQIAGDVAEYLSGSKMSTAALLKLQGVLRDAQTAGLAGPQVAEAIKQQVPEAASFGAWLKDSRIGGLSNILNVFITAVGVILAYKTLQLTAAQPSTEEILTRLIPLLRAPQVQPAEPSSDALVCDDDDDKP
jgi:hypothetical protein